MTLANRLRARLAEGAGRAMLHDGDAAWERRGPGEPKPAAVLVGFVDRPRPTLLLTRRQAHLRSHSGQVAFPGGRADPEDVDLIATALREAAEEVALPYGAAEVIGLIEPYRTITAYTVTPVLAVLPPDLPLVAHEGEVARIFEAPVDLLFDPAQQQRRAIDWDGGVRHYYEMAVDGERVWGATAGMIRNIGALLGLDVEPWALNRVTA
jgi:8-oxo-dGTP pyrophosphatase MutT (NUDIX family)